MDLRGRIVFRKSTLINRIILINVVVFIFQYLAGSVGNRLEHTFGLVPGVVINQLQVWQFFTYLFLHGGIFHLFFNMFGLWMFGRELEYIWGPKEFLRYYLITGIGAGIISWVTGGDSLVPIIGASGAVMGVLIAYVLYFPNRYLYIYGIFPMKAKYLALLYIVIEIFQEISPKEDYVAHIAHLGGIFVGFIYLKVNWKSISIENIKKAYRNYRKGYLYRVHKDKEKKLKELKEEVDLILDKINTEGIESLSRQEKKKLEDASNFLKKLNKNSKDDTSSQKGRMFWK